LAPPDIGVVEEDKVLDATVILIGGTVRVTRLGPANTVITFGADRAEDRRCLRQGHTLGRTDEA